MTSVSAGRVVRGVMAVLGVAVLPALLHAQTPPRPAVNVRQIPSMFRSVLPADFDNDGRLDLVAGEGNIPDSTLRRVVVRLGNGDGTFGSAIATGATGFPAAVGDFNGDDVPDVVVIGQAGAMSIVEGVGNGTFGHIHPLDSVPDFRFALATDINADNALDLVLAWGTNIEIRTGFGDMTFARHPLPPGTESGASAGVIGDFNGDDRPDLAVAQRHRSIVVYINQLNMLFSAREILIEFGFEELPEEINGIASADLNRDGRDDLIVPHTKCVFDCDEGGVDVLLGRSNGTFAPAARYFSDAWGLWTAATGDFNRDGLVDVAIGGNSWTWDDLADLRNYWDSITIFPGRGDGTLAPGAAFRLDNRPPRPGFRSPFTSTHHLLHAADVNGDGHTDLVTSPGAAVLNRPAAANRPPVANAGPDLTPDEFGQTFVSAMFTEPDWDWVSVEWRDELGVIIRRVPSFEFGTNTDRVLTLTVTDVRGASSSDRVLIRGIQNNPVFVDIEEPAPGQRYPSGASIPIRWDSFDGDPVHHFEIYISTDNFLNSTRLAGDIPGTARSFTWQNAGPPGTNWRVKIHVFDQNQNVLASDISEPFTIDEDTGGGLPWPWNEHADVGAVGRAGSATYDNANRIFTVRGSGADIWNTADEFHYVSARMGGNFSLTARVLSVENVNQWTKAGLMLREGTGASARHASLFVTPSTVKGVAFQRRREIGAASVHTAGPAATAPIWLKLIRRGNTITAFYRKNITDGWTLIGEQEIDNLAFELHAMLVVSSHVDGRLAAARFDNVVLDRLEFLFSEDLGITRAGTTSTDGVTITMEGDGADIWAASDSFRFHRTVVFGDSSITARVRSLENTHRWAKAGVMFRESASPASPHVMLMVTPGMGIALQYRTMKGGESAQAAIRPGTAPEWLRLVRSGNTFTALASNDGLTWSTVGSVTIPLDPLVVTGLAVTSHSAGVLATAVFDDLVIREHGSLDP